jgi:hypothetical protein
MAGGNRTPSSTRALTLCILLPSQSRTSRHGLHDRIGLPGKQSLSCENGWNSVVLDLRRGPSPMRHITYMMVTIHEWERISHDRIYFNTYPYNSGNQAELPIHNCKPTLLFNIYGYVSINAGWRVTYMCIITMRYGSQCNKPLL